MRYNILEAIYLSFFSKRLYRDVVASWGGYAVLYLLMIVSLSWIGATWQMQRSLTMLYNDNSFDIVSQVPVVTINNGIASTPENKPYIVRAPDKQTVIAIIDTTGQYSNIQEANTPLLITKHKVITYQAKKHETRSYDFPKNREMTVNPTVINGYIAKFVGYLWIPLFISLVIFTFIYRLIQVLIYSVAGLFFNYFYGAPVTYGQIAQMTMVALTPAIALSTVLDFMRPGHHVSPVLYLVISLGYMCYAIAANKNKETLPE